MHREAAESTQQKLKASALKVLEESGLTNFRIADVIARAQVARGTYYLYYKDASDVLRALALDFVEGLENDLNSLPVVVSINTLISGVMNTYVQYIVQHRVAAALTFQLASSDPEVMQRFDAMIQRWADNAASAIVHTKASSESRAELARLSLAMICMLEGYFRYALRGDNVPAAALQRDAKTSTDIFIKIWTRAVSV